MTGATKAALGVLEPVGRGEFNGSPSSYTPLRSAVEQIGRLVSAQNAAYERLTQSIFAYRRLLPEPDAASPADAAARDLDNGQVSGRDDDWAVSADLRLRALEAVEAGGLRFHQSGVYGYISLGRARRAPRRQGLARNRPTTGRRRAVGPGYQRGTVPAGTAPLAHAERRSGPARRTYSHAARLRRPQPQQHHGAPRRRRPVCRTRDRRGHQAFPLPLIPPERTSPMSIPVQPSAFSIGSIDAQRVEDALSLIAPRWTIWSAQTLAQQGRPMRVGEVAAQLPFISEAFVSKRLAQMHADGLVVRVGYQRGAPYQLSAFGDSLSSVHDALSSWSQAHLSLGRMAGAERVENAVQRLYLRHSTAVIQLLDANGPMRFGHISEETGLDNGFTRYRLNRLQDDGLVARTGPRHGDPYVLTDAGRALGPVYEAVEYWSNPVTAWRNSAPPAPVTTANRTHADVPLGSDGVRTAAALRRSAPAANALFSHAPQPQPRPPATVTARSSLSRGH